MSVSKRWMVFGASLALAVGLLALSLVLMVGLAHAQNGSISGIVTYYGGVSGIHTINISVFTDTTQSPVPGVGDDLLSPGGTYTVTGLADDDYYVLAFLDANDSGGPPDDGEPVAWYDSDGDGNPDEVTVAGGAVTGIDIALSGPWLPLGGPIATGGQVNALAVHPAISGTVYAAAAPVGASDSGPSVIYKTTDGAGLWTAVYTAEHQVYALAVTGTNVYAGAFNPGGEGPSIYVSNDSGVNWTPVFSFTDRGVWIDMAVHPTDANVAIAGGWLDQGGQERGVVYGTDDSGLTWSSLLTVTVPGDDASVNAMLIHPVTPTLLLAAARADNSSDGIVYRSENGGVTWPVSDTITGAQFMSLVAHANNPQMLYAGTTWSDFSQGPSRVFRSTDAGLSWTEVFGDAGGSLAFEPPNTVYAVTNSGRVSRSTSDGAPGTWSQVGRTDGGLSFDLDLGPAPPAALYVGGDARGVFKSTNSGADWEEHSNGIEAAVQPCDIDVDPQNLDKLFVAAGSGGGWMTTDGGQAWAEPSGIAGHMGAFAVNPENSNIVYGGAYDCSRGAVLRSEDGGLNFEAVYTATFIMPDCSGGDEGILALAIAPSMTSTVYASGRNKPNWGEDQAVIVRSLNGGDSWTEVFSLPAESRVETVAINPADDDTVHAGGEDCSGPDCVGFIYRTTNGGDNWTQIFAPTDTVCSIVVDYRRPDVLYASDNGYRVYKSTDGGDNWTTVHRPPWEGGSWSGNLLAIDPRVPSYLYLGGWGYVGETTDGGQTWSSGDDPLSIGLPGMEPDALVANSGTPTQTLYAGLSGVWLYSRQSPPQPPLYLPIILKNY